MKNNEIINGNKLIAEFMGRKFIPYKDNKSVNREFATYSECEDYINENKLKRYLPELGWGMGFGKYDTSWDELMPVVDKIHFLRMKDVYRRSNVSVKGDKIFTLYISAQIESVWLAVVNFIEWYNANVAATG